MTYQKIFEQFLNHVMIFNTSETYRCYSSHLNCVLIYFKKYDPKNLDYNTLTNYVIFSRQNNISNSTLNKRLRIMKQAFKFNKIVNEDLQNFPKLKVIDKRFNALTLEQVKKLIDYLDNSSISAQAKALFSIFLFCGVRLTELLNIKAKNIDFTNNTILLEHTKAYRQRYVFFNEDCKRKYLLPYFATLENITNDTLFFNLKKGGVVSTFRRAKAKLKFATFSPHVLRHTYATLLVSNNANISFIASTLGHSSLEMTKRYLHQDVVNQKKVYEQYFVIN